MILRGPGVPEPEKTFPPAAKGGAQPPAVTPNVPVDELPAPAGNAPNKTVEVIERNTTAAPIVLDLMTAELGNQPGQLDWLVQEDLELKQVARARAAVGATSRALVTLQAELDDLFRRRADYLHQSSTGLPPIVSRRLADDIHTQQLEIAASRDRLTRATFALDQLLQRR